MVQISALFSTLVAISLANLAQGHMYMSNPPSFGTKENKFVTEAGIDYTSTAPLSGASQFPCKGYHTDQKRGAGRSVATWAAGSTQSLR
jgi:hypothetical protein